MNTQNTQNKQGIVNSNQAAPVPSLRPPNRWHDPLQLIQNNPPSQIGRIVLWTVSILVFILIIWAILGKLDIIASADGKLVPQTLVKIVQPAETGIVTELLVGEGDQVKQGQVLARLDTTLAKADKTSVYHDLKTQHMQVRRILAELAGVPMQSKAEDDLNLFQQIQQQFQARRNALQVSIEQEQAQLRKLEQEHKSALEILNKYEQLAPSLKKSADNFAALEKEGVVSYTTSADKQRAHIENQNNLSAQQASVAALHATIQTQHKRIVQIKSNYHSELQKELAELRQRIGQLQPTLDKSTYREGLMELKAPQDGAIKDLATTTVGAVVQPGSVVMTLVPKDEHLYADVAIKNEDVGFVQIGQTVQIKLVTFPFQRYGMLQGKITHLSADANEQNSTNKMADNSTSNQERTSGITATYKARVKLEQQNLIDTQGKKHQLSAGMQVVAEIKQGRRTVMEYLLSPVQKTVGEAGRER